MPHLEATPFAALAIWCFVVVAFLAFLVMRPLRAFSLIAWGRPLPGFIRKAWVIAAYRVFAMVVIYQVTRLFIEAARQR